MEKENSTEEEPVGFPAPKNAKEVDHNINVPTKNSVSDDEMAGTATDTGEERVENAPYVHEDDPDIKPATTALMEDSSNDMEIRSQDDDKLIDNNTPSSSVGLLNSENLADTRAGEPDIQKEDREKGNSVNDITLSSTATSSLPSTPAAKHLLDDEPDEEIVSSSKRHLVDEEIEDSSNDMEIRSQDDDTLIDVSPPSSSVGLLSSENSVNTSVGERNIQKEDEKGNSVNDTTLSCTAADVELRSREEDNSTTSSSSSSPSENSINAIAHEPDIQMENHGKGNIVNDTIPDYNAEEGEILDHGDTKTDPTNNTSGKAEVEAKTAALPGKPSVLTKFVKLCAASNIFRHLSKGTDEHNDSNEKDNKNNESSKGGGQEVSRTSHTTPEKPRWSLSNLSLIRISNDKNQRNKSDSKDEYLESPDLIATKGRILLYTKLWCEKCREARKILRKRRLRYSEINIDMYPSRKVELEDLTGSSDVPKVFFNQVLIEGLKKLKRLDESGQLDKKIEYVTSEGPSPKAPLPPLSGEDDASTRGGVDELAVIVRKMKRSIVVRDRFYKFRRVTNCFLGSEAVDFLSEDQFLEREGAIEFARKLAKELFFRHVFEENTFEDGNHLYRFLDQDPVISQCQNIPRGIIQRKRQPLGELSHRLRFLLYAILDAYTSEDGRHIAYRSIHGSEEFARYLRIAEELQRLDLNKTSKEERLAFFINLYNLMTIHAILVWGHPEGALDRRKMLSDFKYVIGGCAYSLSDIQNGILRANQRPPYALVRPFSISDKRFKVSLPYLEPLIHFALVSGNRSAPALRCYSPKNIDRELMDAARDFLQSGAFVLHLDSMSVSVTKILNWYSVDFGKNEAEILKHAAIYLEVEQTRTLMELLDSTPQLKVVYQPYDWRLNS
ncbi:putative DEP domain, glutaredoxin, Thioredoxin-like superfamily [Helianthus annuus]|nr:uncharacterized protein LOC110936917 [Helianthus annuus]KAJ0580564.1 putative DEP domain, glutaredoxin, Thioredoxin-like superfamily [Helianthus annuus]KAJ0588168.1 putative DEP domain, glutaredoxin, Thioredoxin-like superfamily [Helianthus annuus]KAJ0596521.1 putative DEP domain, glutaredoxin, Thioredoxin-like superfamily [Helianthus annuus]KAJ0757181.1 putative DEP domain, glutaredoxin, Thioredoxin-like superfamily [Helianthus annuus]KAJ0760906.1 putative DEP domain, glutaredoxin, Thiored